MKNDIQKTGEFIMPKQENYLKESIKRFYKQYTEERSEQKPTLADIAKLFKLILMIICL